MKRVFLVEIDVPEDEKEPKDWLKQLLGTQAQVRYLRYNDFDEYDYDRDTEYWR